MLRSFARLAGIDPGFRPQGVLTLRLSLPSADYPEASDVVATYDRILERVRGLPGVERAGAVRYLPLSGTIGDWTIEIEGREPAPGQDFDGDWQVVTPGYFEAMRIPLVEGRTITAGDRIDAAPAIVVSETLARDYWPGESALGKRIRFGAPHAQWAQSTGGGSIRSLALVMRSGTDPRTLVGPVREIVRDVDPRVPLAGVRTMEEVVAAAIAEPRFSMMLLVAFAALAVLLAAIGIYGVMAYSVRQRNHEIGIRMALGARASDVLELVVRQGMLLVVGGLALGLAGALALTRVLGGLLYGVEPTDPVTFAGVTVLLVAVAFAACYWPAQRAASVDPMEALRYE
jgi:putative ABC transport system permease protein